MNTEKALNTNLFEESGNVNEVEELEEGVLKVNEDDEEGTLDIVPEVPQEFIDKYHRNVSAEHGVNNSSDNK